MKRIETIQELAALPSGTKVTRLIDGQEEAFKMIQNGLGRDDFAVIFKGNAQVVRHNDFGKAKWFLDFNGQEGGIQIIQQLEKMKEDYIAKIDMDIEAVKKFYV